MNDNEPVVRVVYYNKYPHAHKNQPVKGYAIEMRDTDSPNKEWILTLFCEDKEGFVHSSFIEAIANICNMGYDIKWKI